MFYNGPTTATDSVTKQLHFLAYGDFDSELALTRTSGAAVRESFVEQYTDPVTDSGPVKADSITEIVPRTLTTVNTDSSQTAYR